MPTNKKSKMTATLSSSAFGLFCGVLLLLVGMASPGWAIPTPGEVAAMERKKAVAEAEARQEIEMLFSRLCPGRCELIGVKAAVTQPKAVGEVTPGFGGLGATSAFDVKLKRIEAKVMIDSALPKQFRNNIVPMLRYRLSKITPNVIISPAILEFPKPHMEPVAEPPEQPKEEPKKEEPKAEEPKKEEPPPTPKEEPKKEKKEDTDWWGKLLKELIPWIPYALMMVITIIGCVVLLNKLREILEMQAKFGTPVPDDDTGEEPMMPDFDALRQELKQSRAVQNEVLRRWVQDDAAAVATLVRMLGADILSDLKNDGASRTGMEEVSELVASQREPLQAREAQRVAREARSRITAALVLHGEQGLKGDWEFMEGLSVAQIQRVMSTLSADEKSYAIGQLPSGLRAAYMEQMGAKERQELFLSAGSGESLSKEQAIDLAARMRRSAEDVSHIGGEASGQAMVIVEMLRALPLAEQSDTLRTMRQRRPEVAQAVFMQIALESAVLHVPPEVVADTMQRTPIDVLTFFLKGTRDDIRDHMLSLAPGSVRGPVMSELELEIPISRSDFLDARTQVLDSLAAIARRDGIDLASVNARAIES